MHDEAVGFELVSLIAAGLRVHASPCVSRNESSEFVRISRRHPIAFAWNFR